MKTYLLFILTLILISCGSSNQFAKRKYTKGVYVEKRSHPKKPKGEKKKTTFLAQKGTKKSETSPFLNNNDDKMAQNEIHQKNEIAKDLNNVDKHIIEDSYDYEAIPLEENNNHGAIKESQLISDAEATELARGKQKFWWGFGLTLCGIILFGILITFLLLEMYFYWYILLAFASLFTLIGVILMPIGFKKMKSLKVSPSVQPKKPDPDPKKIMTKSIVAIITGVLAAFFVPTAYLMALFTGIVGIYVFFSMALVLGIVAFVYSIILLSNKEILTKAERRMAIWALILGILAILVSVFFIAMGIWMF